MNSTSIAVATTFSKPHAQSGDGTQLILQLSLRAMAQFPHDTIKPFSETEGKKPQVRQMFDTIAPRYDLMNHFLSLGIDRWWRRKAIGLFKKEMPKQLLDMATGTADMALLAAKLLHPEKITGIDLSENMLQIGRQKVAAANRSTNIELLQGDSETIQFGNDVFDGVMVAFGVRNFENLQQGLGEMHRVLKPGGRLVVLEFSRPVWGPARAFCDVYMGSVAPQLARLFNQNKQAYQYLNKSANAFPERDAFVQILSQAGYVQTSFRALTFGICCIYTGRKPA